MSKEMEKIGEGAMAVIAGGQALVQTQTGYQTAMAVQQPRQIDVVVLACEREAEYAAGSAYYSWMVNDRRNNRKVPVEGLSIGGLMAIAREWGNCAVIPTLEETKDAYIFTASFVDVEKGLTVSRIFKQTKTKQKKNDYDGARYADMQLQIGQSKAIRNAIKAGVPAWLQGKVLAIAKQAVIDGVNADGIDKARKKVLNFLAGHGVDEQMVVNVMGKPVNEWTAGDVATLRGMCQQINDGSDSAESLFQQTPSQTNKKKTVEEQNEKVEAVKKVVDEQKDLETNKEKEPIDEPTDSIDAEIRHPSEGTAGEPEEEQQKPEKTYTQWREEMEAITDYDTLIEWGKENAEQVEADISPNSKARFNNLFAECSKRLFAKKENQEPKDKHVEGEDITTSSPEPGAGNGEEEEPGENDGGEEEEVVLDFAYYKAEYAVLENVLDCSRFLVNREDELRENLSHEDYEKFQTLANEHIVWLRAKKKKEANE